MKWTRSFNVVKVLHPAVLAGGLSASLASAQVQGKFTLPFEARWGQATLPPGEYSFNLDTARVANIALVRQGQRTVALIMADSQTEQHEVTGSSALVAVRSGGKYRIRALRLAEAGVVLEYMPPKAERQILARAPQLLQRVPILMAAN